MSVLAAPLRPNGPAATDALPPSENLLPAMSERAPRPS
jgi:hypothetical protein